MIQMEKLIISKLELMRYDETSIRKILLIVDMFITPIKENSHKLQLFNS